MNKNQKKQVLRIVSVALILIISYFLENEILRIALNMFGYFVAGYDIIIKAIKNILNRNFLDEFFL